MYNKVVMMGRIVNDPELKSTPNGVNVCSYRIAVDRRFTPKGEEKKSDFFNVVSWRNDAEFVAKYFSKGRMILIEGELQTRQYTDKNGNNATWYEIITDRVSFTGEKKDGGAGVAQGRPPVPSTPTVPSVAGPTGNVLVDGESSDDDYPF